MPNKNDKVFHSTVAHNNPMSNLPTPFQMIGSGVKKIVKGAGRAVLKTFVDPSINVAKRKDAEIERKRKSGELLY